MKDYKLTIVYPKKETLTVTCSKESNISNYCKKYGINVSSKIRGAVK